MSQKTYLGVAGVIFLIVAALHGLRLLFGWGVEIGTFKFPPYISVVALGLASFMAYQSFKLRVKV